MASLIRGQKLAHFYRLDPAKTISELREGLEKGHVKPQEFSIRDLFESLVEGGHEIVKNWDPRFGGGGPSNLMEAGAINSGAFANITGQIIYTTVMQAYQPPVFVGDQLVTTQPTQFNGEKIPGITGLGDQAEVVDELQPYPLAGVSEDWVETPQTSKRGLRVEISKETVFFDRTNLVLSRAAAVGESLGVNMEKRKLDLVLGVTNNYKWKGTAYNTYGDTPWDNLIASNGLTDWRNLDAGLLAFGALTDPATGEPIVIVPNTVIVHSANRTKANYILNATQVVIDPNASAGTANHQLWIPNNAVTKSYNVVSSPWIDTRYSAGSIANTTWFFGDFKRAFAYMENWPLTVSQMPPNAPAEYERDVVAGWKVSERGVPAVLDPRYVQKHTA